MLQIKKAILPIAGLGTRFLPLSKAVPKELWPLADKPMIQYIIEEAVISGINQIIFVIPLEKRIVFDYFKKTPKKLERILKERKKEQVLERLKKLEGILRDISVSFVVEKEPLGDGHALLQAKRLVGKDPCAVLFSDDIVESRTPCILQLTQVFKSCQKSVLALHRIPKERVPFYGVVDAEKIAFRLYKIKKIVEKSSVEQAPSDLAIVGKYILTPEVFDYLKRTPANKRGEIILADALGKMVEDGKMVYAYEFEGEWWECGNVQSYLKSNFHFSLNHSQFGPELKEYFKGIK